MCLLYLSQQPNWPNVVHCSRPFSLTGMSSVQICCPLTACHVHNIGEMACMQTHLHRWIVQSSAYKAKSLFAETRLRLLGSLRLFDIHRTINWWRILYFTRNDFANGESDHSLDCGVNHLYDIKTIVTGDMIWVLPFWSIYQKYYANVGGDDWRQYCTVNCTECKEVIVNAMNNAQVLFPT